MHDKIEMKILYNLLNKLNWYSVRIFQTLLPNEKPYNNIEGEKLRQKWLETREIELKIF